MKPLLIHCLALLLALAPLSGAPSNDAVPEVMLFERPTNFERLDRDSGNRTGLIEMAVILGTGTLVLMLASRIIRSAV